MEKLRRQVILIGILLTAICMKNKTVVRKSGDVVTERDNSTEHLRYAGYQHREESLGGKTATHCTEPDLRLRAPSLDYLCFDFVVRRFIVPTKRSASDPEGSAVDFAGYRLDVTA